MSALHPHLKLISTQIRKIRKAKGWSQENFAVHLGLARSYYSGVERGERNLAAINLIKIAQGLEVEVGELFPPVAELPVVDEVGVKRRKISRKPIQTAED